MIKDFCLAWEKNKGKLEECFRTTPQSEYDSYELLVRRLFDIVINPEIHYEYDKFNTEDFLIIDDDDYQGAQVFILHRNTHQPSVEDYVYLHTYYVSCSGYDTLQAIHCYEDGLPSEQQVADYMDLCLHLLQKCRFMIDIENNVAFKEKDESIIEIHRDGHYVEILGNRIYRNDKWNTNEAMDSWNNFLEYLYNCEKAKKENESLKSKLKQIKKLCNE